MIPDPIVEEVRSIRDEIAKEFGYDINAIFQALRLLDATSSTPHVAFPGRRVDEVDRQESPPVKGAA